VAVRADETATVADVADGDAAIGERVHEEKRVVEWSAGPAGVL
jgi:hypothetical protein